MSSEGLLSFLGAVVGSIITLAVSVPFALRRFREERWWERKVEAYVGLFTALFDVQRSLRQRVREVEEAFTTPETFAKELGAKASLGYTEIRRAATIGTFLFSEETADRLASLMEVLDDPNYNLDFHEEDLTNLRAVTTAMADLKPLARKDLALSGHTAFRGLRFITRTRDRDGAEALTTTEVTD